MILKNRNLLTNITKLYRNYSSIANHVKENKINIFPSYTVNDNVKNESSGPPVTTLEKRVWKPESRRTGVLAVKIGMMPVWDQWGLRHNCSVLQIEDCQVVGIKYNEKHGYTSLQLGGGIRKEKNVKKPVIGQYLAANIPVKRSLQEFRVTPDALLPIQTKLTADHFVPGQYLDVCGISKGKGFQGVMKRHNFKGQPASHGNSKTHRHAGSTGQCQDPGRVFPGKKMAGRMGNKRVTRDNLYLVQIDIRRNLLYVRGSIPGNIGGIIRVTDARKKYNTDFSIEDPPPFPTIIRKEGEEIPLEPILAKKSEQDPYNYN